LTRLPTIELDPTMNLIDFIDRVLWGTRIASLTSPTYVGDYMPLDDADPSAARTYSDESRTVLRDREDVYFADA
jgi:hypothetical protein